MSPVAKEWLAALVALVVLVPLLPTLILLSRRGRRRGGGMATLFGGLEAVLDPSRRHVVVARQHVAEPRGSDEPLGGEDP